MSELKTKLQDLKQQMADLRKNIEEQAKAFFKEAAAELFEKHPNLNSFSWTQYTPYWNDGETCEFSAHTDYFNLSMKKAAEAQVPGLEDEDYDEEEDFSAWSIKRTPDSQLSELQRAGKDIAAFLEIFSDEDFEAMFGDHVKVKVTRDAVTTDEYEHE